MYLPLPPPSSLGMSLEPKVELEQEENGLGKKAVHLPHGGTVEVHHEPLARVERDRVRELDS